MKYGLLTVIRQYQKNHGNRNRLFVECVCDCGNVVERRLDGLKQGHNTDCGCLKKGEIESLIGKKYGIITVTGTHKNYRGDTMRIVDVDTKDESIIAEAVGHIKTLRTNRQPYLMLDTVNGVHLIYNGGFDRSQYKLQRDIHKNNPTLLYYKQ